jgi:hypothetical protein
MSDKKKRKKKYFPNNYDAVAGCPAEWFHPIPFDELMEWKIGGYEIPSSVNCIIREKRVDTGEVTEYVYQSATRAKNKARQIMDEGVSELTVCTEDAVHHLYPQQVPEYDDPLA